MCQAQVDFIQPTIKSASACGYVLDKNGEGIPTATVTLIGKDDSRFEANTDENGRFTFDRKSGSIWKLSVRAPGFMAAEGPISKLRPTSRDKCDKPVYAVLDVGGLYTYSFLTTKHSDIKKLKKHSDTAKD